MRILIDECLDWRLGRELARHTATSVQKMGWSGISNGSLLKLAVEHGFDVFMTADRNLSFQQNTVAFKIRIIVLEALSTRLSDTLPLLPRVLAMLLTAPPGTVTRIR